MAQSEEWKKMQLEIKRLVVPGLRSAGFSGSFPHLRRARDGKAELISFLASGRDGGAFEVGASILFLDADDPNRTNLFYPDSKVPLNKLCWGDGRIRNSLPGMYGGAFYYVDVYAKDVAWYDQDRQIMHTGTCYSAVTPKYEKYVLEHLKANNYSLIQKADETTCTRVAEEAARQMPELLLWFDRIRTYDDLEAFKDQRNRAIREEELRRRQESV